MYESKCSQKPYIGNISRNYILKDEYLISDTYSSYDMSNSEACKSETSATNTVPVSNITQTNIQPREASPYRPTFTPNISNHIQTVEKPRNRGSEDYRNTKSSVIDVSTKYNTLNTLKSPLNYDNYRISTVKNDDSKTNGYIYHHKALSTIRQVPRHDVIYKGTNFEHNSDIGKVSTLSTRPIDRRYNENANDQNAKGYRGEREQKKSIDLSTRYHCVDNIHLKRIPKDNKQIDNKRNVKKEDKRNKSNKMEDKQYMYTHESTKLYNKADNRNSRKLKGNCKCLTFHYGDDEDEESHIDSVTDVQVLKPILVPKTTKHEFSIEKPVKQVHFDVSENSSNHTTSTNTTFLHRRFLNYHNRKCLNSSQWENPIKYVFSTC